MLQGPPLLFNVKEVLSFLAISRDRYGNDDSTDNAVVEDDVTVNAQDIDLSELKTAVDLAIEALEAQATLLEPHIAYLTPEQRQQITKPPLRFLDAGKRVAFASQGVPRLLAAAQGYNPDDVLENLEIAEILGPLVHHSQMLLQLVTDARNHHLALAYDASLELYRIGKPMGETDPKILEVIKPIAQMFSGRGKGNDKDDDKDDEEKSAAAK